MNEIRDLINAFIRLFFKDFELYSVEGIVSNVRESDRLCDLKPTDGAKIIDVKLNSVEGSDTGLVLIPKDGTNAIATFINSDLAYLCLPKEVDKVLMKIKSTTFEMNDGNTIFNGGGNDGFTNVNDVVTELKKTQTDSNNLKTAISGWVPVPNDGGAALKTALATWYAASITVTTKSDIEDTTITH